MAIVPADDHLEAEVMVSNRDIGFIDESERVEVKVDMFNFARETIRHANCSVLFRLRSFPEI
jgi:hypothetical protein